MTHLRLSCLVLAALPFFATGCCCVQGVSTCSTGNCGGGSIASLSSCRGACGDVYVDEWISEPPTIDNCAQPCGGCGHCNECQPVRNLLKALWGRPYGACCPNELVGPSCGCDSCSGGGSSHASMACDCGMDHHMQSGTVREVPHGATQMKPAPTQAESKEVVPTPAPEIDPMASRKLNPAERRRAVRTASTRYR